MQRARIDSADLPDEAKQLILRGNAERSAATISLLSGLHSSQDGSDIVADRLLSRRGKPK